MKYKINTEFSFKDLRVKTGRYETKIKYGIFEINDAEYLDAGALKLQLINDSFYQYHNSEEEAISVVTEDYEYEGSYVILPVYVKEEVEL